MSLFISNKRVNTRKARDIIYQQITLIGNLGGDPELRFTPSGVAVASFNLAVNRSWNDANGQKQDKTTWFRVSVWNKQAEAVSQYLTKGRQVLVIGEMEEARAFTDKEGNARASLEVKAQSVRFLGQRGGEGSTPTETSDTSQDIPF